MIRQITPLRNETELKFSDITSEMFREYYFPGGETVMIDQPAFLSVSPSGGHRILDRSGNSNYIPSGWIRILWRSFDDKPHFVK